MKFSGVVILQGVEFSIFLLIFEWALQQCSATALPVVYHTVIWGILSLLCVIFFVCTVTDFSAAEKDTGVKFCMHVRLLSRRTSPIVEVKGQRSRSPGTTNSLSAANTHTGA